MKVRAGSELRSYLEDHFIDIPKLIERSGFQVATVYNIIKGSTPRPHVNTRKLLSDAINDIFIEYGYANRLHLFVDDEGVFAEVSENQGESRMQPSKDDNDKFSVKMIPTEYYDLLEKLERVKDTKRRKALLKLMSDMADEFARGDDGGS